MSDLNIDALRALQERVRAAGGPDRELDGDIAIHLLGWSFKKMKRDASAYWRKPEWSDLYYKRVIAGPPAHTASIDTAVALIEKVLPDFTGWELSSRCSLTQYLAELSKLDDDDVELAFTGHGLTPPLALLDALLSALIARSETGDAA